MAVLRCRRADKRGGLFEKRFPRTPSKNFMVPLTYSRADRCTGGASACAAGKRKSARTSPGKHRESSRCLAADLMWGKMKSNSSRSQGCWGLGRPARARERGRKLRRLRWFLPLSLKRTVRVCLCGQSRTPVPTGMAGHFPQRRGRSKPFPYRGEPTLSLRPGAPRPTLIIATGKSPLHNWCQLHGADEAFLMRLASISAEASSREGSFLRGESPSEGFPS